ncbi:hypothetical protein AVEN_4562-1 [Araneus ventricosus]|uniref:Uncharacterized protein n=1 Tax=Araneus ventricosus TaxID=182803 RepID=A0A4Y2BNU6_ARAVE|nr:hypothetical protein AVEN_4562-1 [Araneus ventricosus]
MRYSLSLQHIPLRLKSNQNESSYRVQALRSSKSNFILKIKENLSTASGYVGLSWVRAHADNTGNETVDHFTKSATEIGNDFEIHVPYSFLKKNIKRDLLNNWSLNWRYPETGERDKDFLPTPDLLSLTLDKYLVYLITGYGTFMA